MNQTVLLVTLIGTLSSSFAIVVAAITIGRTLVAVTNSINTMNAQASNAVASLSSQFQVHVTETAGKLEMLEYKVAGVDQKTDHKANRLLTEIDKLTGKIAQVEGFISKAHGYKIRTRPANEES